MPDALAKQVCPFALTPMGHWHKGLQDITSFGAHDGISTGSFSGPTGMRILGGHQPTCKRKCVHGFSDLEDDHSSEDAEEPNCPVVVGIEDFPRLDHEEQEAAECHRQCELDVSLNMKGCVPIQT